ncbi:MAG: hypothetical protein ABIT37_05815 [Luteolibacter sp.]
MSWTFKGDPDVAVTVVAGVTYGMDETERPLDAPGISGWQLKFQNLGEDAFTYTQKTKNAKGLGAIVPRDGQIISVWCDGVRRFRGHVVAPKLGLNSLTVRVVGPWWWMTKITLSGASVDSTGISADRTSYALPAQGLRTSLQAINNRAVAMGVPMRSILDADVSTYIDGMFTFLKTTLSNMSFAAAMAELMSCVPDAVLWFDYTSFTNPQLNISRRGSMAAATYTVGATGAVRVESADIYPRTDQQVKQVRLNYMKRQAITGKPQWASQVNGTVATDTDKRKVQIITVSGPETLQLVPKDDFDSVQLRTLAANLSVNDVFQLDPVLKKAAETYGAFKGSAAAVSFPGWFRLVYGETVDWMRTDYLLAKKQIAVKLWITGNYISAGGLGLCANYLKSIGRLSWAVGGSGVTNTFSLYLDFTFDAINLSFPTLTTVRKKWDYDFISPPAGLAADLQGAQNFIPWEGPVVIAQQALDGTNLLQKKIRLANSHPDHAMMDALLKSVTYDGGRHRISLELGPPPRADLGGLVNKMRRNPQDNIVWI